MLWIEMSKDEAHGGQGWGFSKCLWSPTQEADGGRQGWWERQRDVCAGDIVLHLRGKNKKTSKFVGISTCSSDCEVTTERPPVPGKWSYAKEFFRTKLEGFRPLTPEISVVELFSLRSRELRNYFNQNKVRKSANRRRLFYVIQGGKLQCQNGAYFSQADAELAMIIFGGNLQDNSKNSVPVGEQYRWILTRLGQAEFSAEVLKNYQNQCCFPNCRVAERTFLVGAHIARWSDILELRGDVSNGLCFCLMHDRAFEVGFFTLDDQLRVVPLDKCNGSDWAKNQIAPFAGQLIKHGKFRPNDEAILHHWDRVGY